MCSRHRQPTTAGVPQGVEVERVAVVVLRVKEVALLAVGELFGITPSFVEPCRASRFQISPEHLGHLVILRQSEHRGLG